MKTLKMILAVSLLTVATISSTLAASPQYPQSYDDVTKSLVVQTLTPEQVADLSDSSRPTARPVSDLEFFAGLQTGSAPTQEGIPGAGNSPTSDDLLQGAYSSAELIAMALEERQSLPLGARIGYMQEQAARIIEISGNRPTEILLRLTLNRSVDIANHILPIAGRNTDYVARFLANFHKENFELAAGFGNNKVGVDSRFTGEMNTADFLRKVSIANFGRMYATLLWRYSQDLSSDSSKAVILMRLLGYLGWDFNSDLRRRERPIAQTIVDIYMLQHSPLYKKIVDTMARGKEPAQEDVAQLRRRTFTILEKLPSRLEAAGIRQ